MVKDQEVPPADDSGVMQSKKAAKKLAKEAEKAAKVSQKGFAN